MITSVSFVPEVPVWFPIVTTLLLTPVGVPIVRALLPPVTVGLPRYHCLFCNEPEGLL